MSNCSTYRNQTSTNSNVLMTKSCNQYRCKTGTNNQDIACHKVTWFGS